MSSVMTVFGPVPSADLGRVMPHEHLLSLVPGPWLTAGRADNQVDLAIGALDGLHSAGFGAVVDLSPYGVVGRSADGANVTQLREISRQSGVDIVAGTSIYLEAYAPGWAREAPLGQLVARLVADAATGIGTTDVRAGVYGEQATSLGEITPFEERMLRAVARAHAENGLAIFTHTTHGTMTQEQLDILQSDGADLDRVVIGHIDTQLSLDVARAVLDRGALIAVDTIGKETWDFFLEPAPAQRPDGDFVKHAFARSDEGRADMVAQLVTEGYGERILLAQDLTGAEVWMNPGTHGQRGYMYLADVFLPMLRERGVDESAIDAMTRTTPVRMLEVTA
ncbi:phosphotriesterase-related protein [Microbacterium keratanolyticum]|uniref:Hydrolase n=1 Tax=Microbacterium keratanolyticum TaxID=67574 RepID=A0A9W6M755_9MICO|nr:hypothetical protein [Microbacterium keratanolyticum]MBM7468573.1 phosphotriesterase-related protein [Microbacterium keratanolyticum]GLK00650.1 hydrolase [Microbacterium keratanolyticum]